MTFQTWLGSWPKWKNTGALFWTPQTPPQIPLFLYHSTKYVPFIVQKPNISCIWREISTQDHAGGVGWIEGRSGSIPWNPYGFMSHSPNLNVTGIKKKSILSLRPQPEIDVSYRFMKWRRHFCGLKRSFVKWPFHESDRSAKSFYRFRADLTGILSEAQKDPRIFSDSWNGHFMNMVFKDSRSKSLCFSISLDVNPKLRMAVQTTCLVFTMSNRLFLVDIYRNP